MRFFISRAIAVSLALFLLAGGAAAQTRKNKKRAASKTSASKTVKSGAMQTQSYTGDPVPPQQAPEHGDGVRRITPAEARAAQEKGTAIIVDVRNEAVFQFGRIKGAILIPSGEIGAHINKLPRNKMIITYCS